MTIAEIRSQVFSILVVDGYFGAAKHGGEVKFPPFIEESEKDATLTVILQDLEKLELVKRIGKTKKWVLSSPAGMEGQKVPISLTTAVAVAEGINSYRKSSNASDSSYCEPLSIKENDIINLVQIIKNLSIPFTPGNN